MVIPLPVTIVEGMSVVVRALTSASAPAQVRSLPVNPKTLYICVCMCAHAQMRVCMYVSTALGSVSLVSATSLR